jgi:hypothetical protein
MSYIRPILSQVKFAQHLLVYEPDIKVSKMTGCGLDNRGPIPGRDSDFPLRHRVQAGSAVRSGFYPTKTGVKDAEA